MTQAATGQKRRQSRDVDVRARISHSDKVAATEVLEEIGISLSDGIRLFLKAVVAEKAIPFELRVPNAKTVAAMKEGRSGKLKGYATVEAMMADIDDEDD